MNFVNEKALDQEIHHLRYLNEGSQGVCYLSCKKKNPNKVYKLFHHYFEQEDSTVSEEELLQFSSIKNNTFVWPEDSIQVNHHVVGYTMPFKKAKNLYQIDPLKVRLSSFEKALTIADKDLKMLTDKHVATFDVMYNTLYGNGHFYIIDTLDYVKKEISYKDNSSVFHKEIKYFLVDNYFDDFVNADLLLRDLYHEQDVSSLLFLKCLRLKLSEYQGEEIKTLGKVKSLVRHREYGHYIRNIEAPVKER